MTILDITDWKTKGLELHQEIENTCGYQSRATLIGLLPDMIRMKQSQFDDLKLLVNMPDMHESDQPYYYTEYNVMEIRVIPDES